MPLGFLGAGAITSALVTGLSAEGGPRPAIRLSPRNPAIAAALAARFPNVTVCAGNQDVLDTSNTIVLAVRPQVAEEVLSALRFSPRHTVITLIANFSVRRIAALVAPAAAVSRAVPFPSAAQRRSPVPLYPPGGPAEAILSPLGPIVPVESEDHLSACSAATSTIAAYFAFTGQIAAWLAAQGIPEPQARDYVARVFSGLAATGLEAGTRTYDDLAAAHATPGGLNEQLLRHLTRHGVFETLSAALDAVRQRTFAPPAEP